MIFAKLLAVILVWFCALALWDVARLHTLRSLRGVLRFLLGCALGLLALTLLSVWLPRSAAGAYSALAIATFAGALVADFLIGDDVRAFLRRAD